MIVSQHGELKSGATEAEIRLVTRVDNAPVLQLAEFYRMLAQNGWKLGKEVRLEAVAPVYPPDGMFAQGAHAHKLDPDQFAYLLKQCPQYKVAPDAVDAVTLG
jgi:hypothetical protein